MTTDIVEALYCDCCICRFVNDCKLSEFRESTPYLVIIVLQDARFVCSETGNILNIP
jgi:hypothetical protein